MYSARDASGLHCTVLLLVQPTSYAKHSLPLGGPSSPLLMRRRLSASRKWCMVAKEYFALGVQGLVHEMYWRMEDIPLAQLHHVCQ